MFANIENSKDFLLSFVPVDSVDANILESDVNEGKQDWAFLLVGYTIGKRPYNESLLAVVKRKWNFKGALDVLTLEEEFFPFKFSCKEDYDLVNDQRPFFLNERDKFQRKWSWDFRPSKENER